MGDLPAGKIPYFNLVRNFPAIPHGLEYPLGSQMHLVIVHPRLEARGRPFSMFPGFGSRLNLRVLEAFDPEASGSTLTPRTPHGCLGVQGIFRTSRGQAPRG